VYLTTLDEVLDDILCPRSDIHGHFERKAHACTVVVIVVALLLLMKADRSPAGTRTHIGDGIESVFVRVGVGWNGFATYITLLGGRNVEDHIISPLVRILDLL
jgi:hypothetical protein